MINYADMFNVKLTKSITSAVTPSLLGGSLGPYLYQWSNKKTFIPCIGDHILWRHDMVVKVYIRDNCYFSVSHLHISRATAVGMDSSLQDWNIKEWGDLAVVKGQKSLTNWSDFIVLPSIMSGAILPQLHNNFTDQDFFYSFWNCSTHQRFIWLLLIFG